MSHLYPSAKAVKRSAEQSKGALAHTGHALHYLQLFTEFALGGLAVGALVALISVRRLRAGFEWGLLWLVAARPGDPARLLRAALRRRGAGDDHRARPRCSSGISASGSSFTSRTAAPVTIEGTRLASGSGRITCCVGVWPAAA